ncbi:MULTISPECIES: LysR substrate-binding domain-containing protein [Pseudoalteromonas]|uniref:LysR substrate-binding domain-containing protein n=1 Tax=Pseudoalteromonas obscura TaxID=3048491 RepID=A0ABT7EP05_9GAMM|nr:MULTISPECIES: LysR substrate-binding domain-containing protein [Pseudoalteromonas]MBQ4838108.1 LysR family transcriptional regulator [Pseudoalteromonas luteoviolacea]MDK2596720.1 LysR substrate-binding domain-containing protein [Pseudoalteromonas sp. P94(2023)]
MYKELLNISGFRMIEAAARLQSYSKAAEELNVTQAAVSQQIRKIEAQIGCKLFYRQGRCMQLTYQGAVLTEAIQNGFELIVEGLKKIQYEPLPGKLTITTTQSFASLVLVPRMWKFSSAYPDIDLRIVTSKEVEDLRQGEIDIAIRYGYSEYPDYHCEVLINDPIVPLCSPAVADVLDPSRPASLKQSWLIDYSGISYWPKWFEHIGIDPDISACQVLQVNNIDVAMSAVLAGHGVCLGSAKQAAHYINEGMLVQPYEFGLMPGTQYRLMYDPQSPRLKRIELFSQWLHKELESL